MSDTNNPSQDTPIPDGFVPATPVAPAAPAPVSPAAAPVAPAPQPEPQAPAPAPAAPKFEKTGDPGLDVALQYVVSKGISADDPAVELARQGDFTAIEAKLKAAGATDYGDHLALAKQAYERFESTAKAKVKEVTDAAEAACASVGGWEKVKTWAGANATPEQAQQINDALAAGGLQAKATLAWLAQAYSRSGAPVVGDVAVKDGVPQTSAQQGLSAKEYATEVEKLYRSNNGRDVSGLPAYKALQARRIAGSKAGL